MKKLMILLLILTGCNAKEKNIRETVSLAGEWGFRIDSLDQGIKESWFNAPFAETVKLPGSMAENGKGDEVKVSTQWTGDIVDRSYFTDKKYEKYRQPGNIKIPFWLKPVKYYKGVAWYRKEVDLPEAFEGKRIVLFLERCHWETTLFVNGENAGTRNSLGTPQEYDITTHLKKGKNILCIRVDNRVIIPVGVNSHSISDHTQGNWNGIAGEISLRATSKAWISDVRIYPQIINRTAHVAVDIENESGGRFEGTLELHATDGRKFKNGIFRLGINNVWHNEEFNIIYDMGSKVKL